MSGLKVLLKCFYKNTVMTNKHHRMIPSNDLKPGGLLKDMNVRNNI